MMGADTRAEARYPMERTLLSVLVLVTWYALPEHRFVAVPLVMVAVFLATIVLLEGRWRTLRDSATVAPA